MIQDPLIRDWLDRFAACVRRGDIEAARALFDPGVHAFGTWMPQAHDLQALVEQQWRQVWFRTKDFHFMEGTLRELPSEDRTQVCVLGLWESQGMDGSGGQYTRRGRCTILLRRHSSGRTGYLAIHSHFSKMPEGAL